jgi:hypothetical protein
MPREEVLGIAEGDESIIDSSSSGYQSERNSEKWDEKSGFEEFI